MLLRLQRHSVNGPTTTGTSLAANANSWLKKRTLALWLAYMALTLILAAPLLLVEVPMGVDTLNHLARIHVRAHIADDADLARLYELRDAWVPYMGLDWLMTPMARVMPTLVAGRVFIILLLWGTVGAVMVLQRTFTGRIGFEPLLVGLVSYNGLLAWGFLNYMLGVVGALLGLAAWHATRGRSWGWRLLLFTGVATSMYFVHLLALALYGAMLGAYEVFGRRQPWRTPLQDWMVLGLQFCPAAVLVLQLPMLPSSGNLGLSWIWGDKPIILASPFLFSGGAGGLDSGLLVFILCAYLLVRLTRAGALRWNRRLAAVALVLAVMGLAVPKRAFGVALVDFRFPVVAAYIAVAALNITPGVGRRLWPVALVLAGAVLFQVASATTAMRACDRQYAEVRAALQAVPRGEVLAAVVETEHPVLGMRCTNLGIYDHLPQLMALDRSGYSPDFFANVTPIAIRNGRTTDKEPIRTHLLAPNMLPQHGYVLWMHFGNHDRPVPPGLTPLREGSFFTLYATE